MAFHYCRYLEKSLLGFYLNCVMELSDFSRFRPDRETCEAISSVRQLQEKSENKIVLCISALSILKRLLTGPSCSLWLVLEKVGCTERFVKLLRLLHDDMECCIAVNDDQSEFSPVTCRMKQGLRYTSQLQSGNYYTKVLKVSAFASAKTVSFSN